MADDADSLHQMRHHLEEVLFSSEVSQASIDALRTCRVEDRPHLRRLTEELLFGSTAHPEIAQAVLTALDNIEDSRVLNLTTPSPLILRFIAPLERMSAIINNVLSATYTPDLEWQAVIKTADGLEQTIAPRQVQRVCATHFEMPKSFYFSNELEPTPAGIVRWRVVLHDGHTQNQLGACYVLLRTGLSNEVEITTEVDTTMDEMVKNRLQPEREAFLHEGLNIQLLHYMQDVPDEVYDIRMKRWHKRRDHYLAQRYLATYSTAMLVYAVLADGVFSAYTIGELQTFQQHLRRATTTARLDAAMRQRMPYGPQRPAKGSPLAMWFSYYDACQGSHIKWTHADTAREVGYTEGTIRKKYSEWKNETHTM